MRIADRFLGSPEIYGHKEREAEQSVNFVTCHDGFTLNDLVSYNQKHNEENGEDNRDGADDNRSWNCGVEGPSDDPADREAAQPAGEELSDRHHAVTRRADDLDGGRSAPYPVRQQQRLLPGQRDQLVRLDATRQARRRAPLREAADRAPPDARCGEGTAARELESVAPRIRNTHGTAQSWSSRIGAPRPTASHSARNFRGRGSNST